MAMKVPQKPPQLPELLTELTKEEPSKFVELVSSELDRQPEGKYVHWDELRHLPLPKGFTHRQWWLAIKMSRRAIHRLHFADRKQMGFTSSVLDTIFMVLQQS